MTARILQTKDFSKICRVCLSESIDMQNIFCSSLSVMFRSLSFVKVEVYDGLPQHICQICSLNIKFVYSFKQVCVKNNFYLRKLLKKERIEKPKFNPQTEPIDIIDLLQYETVLNISDDKDATDEDRSCNDEPIALNDSLENAIQTSNDALDYLLQEGQKIIATERKTTEKPAKETLDSHEFLEIEKDSIESEEGSLCSSESAKNEENCNECKITEKPEVKLTKQIICSYESVKNREHCIESKEGSLYPHESIENKENGIEIKDKKLCSFESVKEGLNSCTLCGCAFSSLEEKETHLSNCYGNLNQRPIFVRGFTKFDAFQSHNNSQCKPTEEPLNEIASNCEAMKNEGWVGSEEGKLCYQESIEDNLGSCSFCGCKYSTLEEKKAHLSNSHANQCPVCDKKFPMLNALQRHIKYHKAKLKGMYVCEFCGKSFSSSTNRKIHIRIHTGEKPHKCDVCQKAFSDRRGLRTHMKAHTERKTTEKPVKETLDSHEFLEIEKDCIESNEGSLCPSESAKNEENCNKRKITEKPEMKLTEQIICSYESVKNKERCIESKEGSLYPHESIENKENCIEIKDKKLCSFESVKKGLDSCTLCGCAFSSLEEKETHLSNCYGNLNQRPIFVREFTKFDAFQSHNNSQCKPTEEPLNEIASNCEAMKNEGWVGSEEGKLCYQESIEDNLGSCSFCGCKFSTLEEKKAHLSNSHANQCPVCDKKFPMLNALQRHIKYHKAKLKGMYVCEFCGKSFSSSTNRKIHIRIHTGEKPHKCDVCQKAFSDRRGLRTHMKAHTGEKQYTCQICGKSFSYSTVLSTHMRVHTSERPYSCSYCDKKFIYATNLKVHIRTHTGEKPYSCQICNRSFRSNSTLKAHMLTHTEEKRYTCNICGKKTARSGDLAVHMRSHTGERPYSCIICSKSYKMASHLSEHMITHTGEKYQCEACGKAYAGTRSLNNHKRKHTGIKPFACDICEKKFTYRSSLYAHKKVHTGAMKKDPD